MGGKKVEEKMQLLKDLQVLDQELNKFRQNRGELESERAELEAGLGRVQDMVDSLAADIENLQSARKELTQSLALEQENVKKAEGRLPSIKTQKEYVAVLKEIDTAKKLNKEIQEQVQAKDGEIEVLAKDKEEKESELSGLREKTETRLEEIDSALASLDQSLGEKEGLRNSFLEKLPVPMRKRYQLLLDRRGGVAVVEARNGACLGCNMHLPPQLFNSLYQLKEIQSCPHCNRLLFIESPDD
jgi:predicted  nucleic acid-binding Zn-ribbon protein